jgi:type I restriction enzyme S subunit
MNSRQWPVVPLAEVLSQHREYIERPEPRQYPKLSVRLYGRGVVLDAPADGSSLKMQRHQIAKSGQVILSEIWGKKGAIGFVPEEGDGALCTSHFFLFDVNESCIERGWLQAIFRANYLAAQLDSQAFGTTGYAAVRPKALLQATIPLPPIGEQRRIVSRVSSIAQRVEAALHLNTQVELLTSRLAASILEGDISSCSNTARLADVIAPNTRVSYGVLVPGPEVDDGVPFVRIQDLDPEAPPAEPAKKIAKEIDAQYARTRLAGNEVLVAVVGATIGKVGTVPQSWVGANIARAVCRIVPGPSIRREFLIAALQAPRVQNYFRDVTRTLAQPTLNVSQLLDTPISCPPLNVQNAILLRLQSLNTRLASVRAIRHAALTKMHAVIPSLLDRAFRGEM